MDGDPTLGKVKVLAMVRTNNLDFNVSRDLAMTGGTIDSNFQLFDPSDEVYTFRFSVDTNATVENVSTPI